MKTPLLPILVIVGIIIVVRLYLVIRARSRSAGESAASRLSAFPRDVRRLVEPFNRPAILIKKTDQKTTSYFGGGPPDYPGFAWPERDGRPLSFLACLDLGAIGTALDWLPQAGLLLFFYDTEAQSWGFDPDDRGAWAVMHVPDASLMRGSAPAPQGLREGQTIRRQSMRFEPVSIPPSWDDEGLTELRLSDAEEEALIDYRSSLYGGAPSHQIGGSPEPVQSSDMPLQCQLVSHGLYCGDQSGYEDPRAEALKSGASDWRLLLQMDSDDELDVMWGDAGMIYFWVRAREARAGDFGNTWLVLQCH